MDEEGGGGASIIVDATLTQAGQAADAKAVGDALAGKQSVGDYATKDYVGSAISAIPTPDVSGQIGAHNTDANAHGDIRGQINSLSSEIANKSAVGHKHTKSEITDFPTSMTPTAHNQAASTITAGTFAGQVVANSGGQTPGTSLLRNSKLVSTDTNPVVNGEICWTYK